MTCKDCVHYEVCGKGVDGAMDCDQMTFESRCPRVEFDCPHFKPKSRFVELPCEVGQTVYFIPHGSYIVESKVANITIEPFEEIGFSICCYGGMNFDLRGFGKTFFLSREEAENALAERSK